MAPSPISPAWQQADHQLLSSSDSTTDASLRRLQMISKRFGIMFPLLALIIGLGCYSRVSAQSTATLQGNITDSKGAVVPNATVTIRNRATATERTTQTDSEGTYQIPSLPVGTYSVEV